jgi:hypothetical protein
VIGIVLAQGTHKLSLPLPPSLPPSLPLSLSLSPGNRTRAARALAGGMEPPQGNTRQGCLTASPLCAFLSYVQHVNLHPFPPTPPSRLHLLRIQACSQFVHMPHSRFCASTFHLFCAPTSHLLRPHIPFRCLHMPDMHIRSTPISLDYACTRV